jgi:hypothetical protein
LTTDYTELTAEALERRSAEGDNGARKELDRRSSSVAPAPKPEFAGVQLASKNDVPSGHVVVRDTHRCTCSHPASELRLDLNTHAMEYPHRCLVDLCPCGGFTYDSPFTQPDIHGVAPVVTTGRFAPREG